MHPEDQHSYMRWVMLALSGVFLIAAGWSFAHSFWGNPGYPTEVLYVIRGFSAGFLMYAVIMAFLSLVNIYRELDKM